MELPENIGGDVSPVEVDECVPARLHHLHPVAVLSEVLAESWNRNKLSIIQRNLVPQACTSSPYQLHSVAVVGKVLAKSWNRNKLSKNSAKSISFKSQ